MVSTEFNITENGGIEITIIDDSGTERSVILEPNDNGDITIKGRGPNGEKQGVMDPSGNGSNPLGK